MRKYRCLKKRSVCRIVKRELKAESYSTWLAGQTSTGEDLSEAVWSQIEAEKKTLLRETSADYRAAAIFSGFPAFIAVTLILGTIICLRGFQPENSGVVTLWWLSPFVLAMGLAYYQQWKISEGRLFSDWLSSKKYLLSGDMLRFSRIPTPQFEFIVQTRLAREINEQIVHSESAALVPTMRSGPKTFDTLNPIDTLTDIRERVIERPDTTLGLVGSRGVGKTTIMKFLTRFEPEIGSVILIRLPSPSDHVDLSRFMLNALATKLAKPREPSRTKTLERRSRIALYAVVLVSLLLFSLTAFTIFLESSADQIGRNIALQLKRGYLFPTEKGAEVDSISVYGLLQEANRIVRDFTVENALMVLLVVLVITVMAWLTYTLRSSWHERKYLMSLANDVCRTLAYEIETSQQSNAGISLRVGSAHSLRGKRTRERDLLQADAYALFERLVSEYRRITNKRILLLVDELDRYQYAASDNQVNSLGNALNQIKPFFLIPGVSGILSVSAEAKAAFDGRSDGTRDVLDSTFDEIIQIPEWTQEELKQYLSYLVPGLSPSTLNKLAELSNGRPRELIRLAWLFCNLIDNRKRIPIELRDCLPKDTAWHNKRSQTDCIRIIENYVHAG